jgi:hypothetical protein
LMRFSAIVSARRFAAKATSCFHIQCVDGLTVSVDPCFHIRSVCYYPDFRWNVQQSWSGAFASNMKGRRNGPA